MVPPPSQAVGEPRADGTFALSGIKVVNFWASCKIVPSRKFSRKDLNSPVKKFLNSLRKIFRLSPTYEIPAP